MKFSKNQWLIALVAAVAVGVGGWFAYASSNSTSGWVTYSNSGGNYSLKYPKTWVHQECSGGAELLLAANAQSLGTCDNAGQMVVIYAAGDIRAQLAIDSTYSNVVKKSVTVSGVTGQKESGDSKTATDSLPAGTKVIGYDFYTNGTTYFAAYAQKTSVPNVQSEFDRMVTKTLKFSK